ncbi:hypothetical protein Nepgr_015183 [Nepenthes gracilis]|uniref:Uncharacterized protein n=1 Tax=Nepenthes gracilis TaxID=150966 RepID=A0AAD3SLN3_NEPGR|nr:hypothetical protein Nepgr_015183 [Nepenthes gracilis]
MTTQQSKSSYFAIIALTLGGHFFNPLQHEQEGYLSLSPPQLKLPPHLQNLSIWKSPKEASADNDPSKGRVVLESEKWPYRLQCQEPFHPPSNVLGEERANMLHGVETLTNP